MFPKSWWSREQKDAMPESLRKKVKFERGNNDENSLRKFVGRQYPSEFYTRQFFGKL